MADTPIERPKFRRSMLAVVLMMHVLSVAAFWWYTPGALIVATVLFLLTGGLGVSMCLHRMYTHGAFRAAPWFEVVLSIFASLAMQAGTIGWVGTHKAHHAFADTPRDPHDARRGFVWSHIGWLFYYSSNEYRRLAPSRMRDSRLHKFLDRYDLVPTVILAIILFAIGGVPWLLWGIFLRVTVLHHFSWAINSVAHMPKLGYQNYATKDTSSNIPWLMPFTFGEHLHNNHHFDERSAKFSRSWREFDPMWPVILLCEKFGWIKDVVRPKQQTAP